MEIMTGPKQPDIGREASSGFQSGPRTASRPYVRPNHRITTVDGGSFVNTVKRDDERLPVAGNPWQKDEATKD
jgi:hypothetical protein